MVAAAKSPAQQLLEAYFLYQRASSEADAKLEEVRRAAPEVIAEVCLQLWALKGNFERPANGEKMFWGREGFASSSAEKAAAIFAHLLGTGDADVTKALVACKAALPARMTVVSYDRNSKGDLVPVHAPGVEEDKVYVGGSLLSGREYRWSHEAATAPLHTAIFDERDEVATVGRPAKSVPSYVAWRAVEGVDYSKLGYIKIGRVWVERVDSHAVEIAQEREIAERKPRIEIVAGGLAQGLGWLEGAVEYVAGGAGHRVTNFLAGVASSLRGHAAATDRAVKSEVFTQLAPKPT